MTNDLFSSYEVQARQIVNRARDEHPGMINNVVLRILELRCTQELTIDEIQLGIAFYAPSLKWTNEELAVELTKLVRAKVLYSHKSGQRDRGYGFNFKTEA